MSPRSLVTAAGLCCGALAAAGVDGRAASQGDPATRARGEWVERVRLPFGPAAPVLEIFHAARDREVARRLARIAARFDPGLFAADRRAGLPASPEAPDTIRLLLASDEAAFRRASGGRSPDWGLAVAFPTESKIVMRSPRLVSGDVQDPGRVLVHELVHVYLALFLGPAERAAPRWFHEGVASLLAGEWGWSERFELGLTLVARRLIPLERLEDGFPPGRDAASLAYLESLTAAAYLRDLSGEEGLRLLLRHLRRLEDFDAAVRRTYGMTYGEFEQRWRESLIRRYGWAMAAASSWTYWTPAALAVVLFMLLRRAKYRRRLAELRREERLRPEDDAQWWATGSAGRGFAEPGEAEEVDEEHGEGRGERFV